MFLKSTPIQKKNVYGISLSKSAKTFKEVNEIQLKSTLWFTVSVQPSKLNPANVWTWTTRMKYFEQKTNDPTEIAPKVSAFAFKFHHFICSRCVTKQQFSRVERIRKLPVEKVGSGRSPRFTGALVSLNYPLEILKTGNKYIV